MMIKKTWMKLTGTFFRKSGGVPMMRFWHPRHDIPIERSVLYLNELEYNIPTKVPKEKEMETKAKVWFDVPKNTPAVSLLIGNDLKVAREAEEQNE